MTLALHNEAIEAAYLNGDLKAMARFKVPRLTAAVISNGLRIARELRERELTIPTLERAIGNIFLKPDSDIKSVRHPVVDILSLAEDVDTEEEAANLSKA